MAKRQEQESASEEVTEVAPDVLRMQLPIHMPGLGHVNMYALLDSEGAAVVDPGMPGPATWKAIQHRLKQAQLQVKDIHTVVVTHSHPDHFGGAARFAKEAGAKVVAHSAFRFGVANPPAEPEVSVDDLAAQRERASREAEDGGEPRDAKPAGQAPAVPGRPNWKGRTPWGGERPKPPWKSRLRWQAMRLLGKGSFVPEISEHVEVNDVLRLAGREFFVVHTPGHTEDHICLHDPAEKVFLAGDHVLPSITPHISGIATSRDPLRAFYESLDLVGALDHVEHCLPAHGHPFTDLRGRTEAIKKHHDERLEKVINIGRALGPATVQAFSEKLFRQRSWGPMAESETFAHLEHLRLAGDAERRDDSEGKFIYVTG